MLLATSTGVAVQKYNPYHDARGRFTSRPGGKGLQPLKGVKTQGFSAGEVVGHHGAYMVTPTGKMVVSRDPMITHEELAERSFKGVKTKVIEEMMIDDGLLRVAVTPGHEVNISVGKKWVPAHRSRIQSIADLVVGGKQSGWLEVVGPTGEATAQAYFHRDIGARQLQQALR